jgi:hypothetical protein
MSRHVHLPPLLPYLGPKPLEKKEKTRRKAAISADKTDSTTEAKAEAVDDPPPAAAPISVNPSPLGTSGGVLSVLLDAQEAAQPADALTRRPTGDDEL